MRQTLSSFEILDQVTIASPCPARWEEMVGDGRARFCSQCQLRVYDLSTLTVDEAANLIREKEGMLCAQIYRRTDGTILTADCPVGLRARAARHLFGLTTFLKFQIAALIGAFFAVFVWANRPDIGRRWLDSVIKPAPRHGGEFERLGGKIMVDCERPPKPDPQ